MKWLVAIALFLAGCGAAPRTGMTAAEARAFIASYIPASVTDRDGWATDIHTAVSVLRIPVTADNVCAIVSVTAQESGFRADPSVPNLAALAWTEIERQREKIGVPKFALDAALSIKSTNGRTYRERIDAAKTERELSDTFEDLIGRVPLGRTFFEDRNPVRTGGPMQVSVAYSRAHAQQKPYPYPVLETIRDEVFTRRGGMYFGIAHLLDYPAPYDRYLYRYADYNAGHYASRNAAFQSAVALLTGTRLALDGDLVVPGKDSPPGATETAVRSLASKLQMGNADIRRDLDLGARLELETTATYRRVLEMAEARNGGPLPRAIVPSIELQSPKFTRRLTTQWFADRVVTRHRQCLARGNKAAQSGFEPSTL
ncbi:MAG: DUF1615 domain-containing protein [Burkholderiales bacterium]|nr:DUF1615 domain-containing protein [Burkholderiales bacterium]